MSVDPALVVVRALHFGASIVLFGEAVFALLADDVRGRVLAAVRPEANVRFERRDRRVAVAAWLTVVVSGIVWLVLVAAQMAGASPSTLDPAALAATLAATEFGHAWAVRAVLVVLWPLAWRAAGAPPRRHASRPARIAAAVVAGALLAGLAWAGHANAEAGAAGAVHHAGDALHLLAAGVWLGGLAPLRSMLRSFDDAPDVAALAAAAALTARFGHVAAASVVVLLLTGGVNVWFLVASPGVLLASAYGNVLVAKLALFALLLGIAAVNRFRWTAMLSVAGSAHARVAAARRLRRNVAVEQLLALALVLAVAWLGVLPPPMGM